MNTGKILQQSVVFIFDQSFDLSTFDTEVELERRLGFPMNRQPDPVEQNVHTYKDTDIYVRIDASAHKFEIIRTDDQEWFLTKAIDFLPPNGDHIIAMGINFLIFLSELDAARLTDSVPHPKVENCQNYDKKVNLIVDSFRGNINFDYRSSSNQPVNTADMRQILQQPQSEFIQQMDSLLRQ